jgi:hypothetical protein
MHIAPLSQRGDVAHGGRFAVSCLSLSADHAAGRMNCFAVSSQESAVNPAEPTTSRNRRDPGTLRLIAIAQTFTTYGRSK